MQTYKTIFAIDNLPHLTDQTRGPLKSKGGK
jgi:hypothetical protein